MAKALSPLDYNVKIDTGENVLVLDYTAQKWYRHAIYIKAVLKRKKLEAVC